ncbi:MAG: ABC transporter ATP-binding protein [Clostridiales bacterium]|nr:ABC transporter ATP-binding protein [Clostridiales bacterium]
MSKSIGNIINDTDLKNIKMSLKNVSVDFKQGKGVFHALDNINLDIYEKDFVCLVGPSGCGKTTMLNIMAGYTKPSSGSVLLEGKPFDHPSAEVGVVFQQANLFPWLSVYKNVEFGLKQQKIPAGERKDIVEHYLNIVNLYDAKDKLPYQLSGGMSQRAAIARTLAAQPKFVLLDEPFSALDALTREMMQIHIRQIWEQTDCSFLFITHDMDKALLLGNRIVVMQADPGRILLDYHNAFREQPSLNYKNLRQQNDYWKARDELIGYISGDVKKTA